jgi:3-hydroxyacyl-[acyl-carrier-protein] dehydratase
MTKKQELRVGFNLEIDDVLRMIPHRYPFLMIDRVIDIVSGESATGIKTVSIAEPHFQGHFPSRPIMPGVLIIEAMAQTSAVMVMQALGGQSVGKLVYFMSIDNARFRRPVVPGDTLKIHIRKERSRGAVWKFSSEAKVDGQLAAEATYSAMIVDE